MTDDVIIVTQIDTVVINDSDTPSVSIITTAIEIVTQGIQGPAGPGTPIRIAGLAIATPVETVIPLVSYAPYQFTMEAIYNLHVTSGSLTLSMLINDVPITGLSDLNVTATPQFPIATGANLVSVGDRLTVAISAVSAASNLEFTSKGTL